MGPLLLCHIKLEAIHNFLKRVAASVDAEYLEIISRAEAGEFSHYDEEGNAFFMPINSEEIAIRATFAELNALIEFEFQDLAAKPLTELQNKKKSKRPKSVWDINREQLRRMIEEYYQVNFEELPGFGKVEEIRRTTNAYKHRRGVKDSNRGDPESKYVPEYFALERENAFQCIEAVTDFLRSLWTATNSRSY